jgi:hypothetical protein
VAAIGRDHFDGFMPRHFALFALVADIVVHVANESGYLCPKCQAAGKWQPPKPPTDPT